MNRTLANKLIYKQSKQLSKQLPVDSFVYIHWKNNQPLVLPKKESGYDIINSVKLSSILNRQLWLLF